MTDLFFHRYLVSASYDKKTDMISLSVKANHEDLSGFLLDGVYTSLYNFYKEETIGRPQKAFESLTIRADSILNRLNVQERDLAKLGDRTKSILSKVSNLILYLTLKDFFLT